LVCFFSRLLRKPRPLNGLFSLLDDALPKEDAALMSDIGLPRLGTAASASCSALKGRFENMGIDESAGLASSISPR